jgi:hypothetical protein
MTVTNEVDTMVEVNAGFERVGRSFWADAKLGDRHLRLFSSMTEVGEVGAVYDMEARSWIAREWADSLEDGKRRAERIAGLVLRELPPIEWRGGP